MLSVRVYTFWGGLSLQDTTRLHICSKLFIYIQLFFHFLIYKDNVCPFTWIIAVEVHLEMICSDTQILFQVCFSQTISLYRSITCILRSQAWPAHFQDFLQTNNSSSEPSSVSSFEGSSKQGSPDYGLQNVPLSTALLILLVHKGVVPILLETLRSQKQVFWATPSLH